MNAFEEAALNQAEYEQMIAGEDDKGNPITLATLFFWELQPPITVPVTHTKIDASFILSAGRSSDTTIERCEFRSSLIPKNLWPLFIKGLKCRLIIKPGATPIGFQLWDGGLMQGAEIFRFMLADESFHA